MSEESGPVESSRKQLFHLIRLLLVASVLFSVAAGIGLYVASSGSAPSSELEPPTSSNSR